MIFKDSAVPCASFYIPDEDKKSAILALHINRFLQIRRPHLRHLPASATRIGDTDALMSNYIHAQLCRGEQPLYPALDDPILSAVKTAASHMNEISRFEVPPVERGIVLFQAARRALRQARADGRTGHLHQAMAGPDTAFSDDDVAENDSADAG